MRRVMCWAERLMRRRCHVRAHLPLNSTAVGMWMAFTKYEARCNRPAVAQVDAQVVGVVNLCEGHAITLNERGFWRDKKAPHIPVLN